MDKLFNAAFDRLSIFDGNDTNLFYIYLEDVYDDVKMECLKIYLTTNKERIRQKNKSHRR